MLKRVQFEHTQIYVYRVKVCEIMLQNSHHFVRNFEIFMRNTFSIDHFWNSDNFPLCHLGGVAVSCVSRCWEKNCEWILHIPRDTELLQLANDIYFLVEFHIIRITRRLPYIYCWRCWIRVGNWSRLAINFDSYRAGAFCFIEL